MKRSIEPTSRTRRTHGPHRSTMFKRYTFWLSAAILFQLLTAVIHTIGLFVRPEPTNETERELVGLLKTYELQAGMGFTPTYADLFTAMGASFTFLLLFSALINGYLLVKQTEPNVMKGILAINVAVFGVSFLTMAVFTFITPIFFTGLIFLNLLVAYVMVPKIEITI